MAYASITKPSLHFNTKLYTGTGAENAQTGVGFQPDFTWVKERTAVAGGYDSHGLHDVVRGASKWMRSNNTDAEVDVTTGFNSGGIGSFTSDGFGIYSGSTGSTDNYNKNTGNYVSWNWKAGGTAPAITYTVKVVSDSGNKYRFDDFGTSAVTLDLQEGGTYTFDQADSSNSGHPLRFYTAADKSGGEYTTGVTTNGTPGSSGAYTRITVAASAPTLYYQCSSHAGMGGQANTNSTFGSSNFSGSIQSNVSANTNAGFSIVSYTGTGSGTPTIGHGLGAVPKMIILKSRSLASSNWTVYHSSLGASSVVRLNSTGSSFSGTAWGSTTPTSSVFTIGTDYDTNQSSATYIAYCFADKTGFSKCGFYYGNGNADGTFAYTGFKPTWIMGKKVDGTTNNWYLFDSVRDTFNLTTKKLRPDTTAAENDNSSKAINIYSNGFKLKNTDAEFNNNGDKYIYLAFGQSLVGSNNIPCTAR